jgi:hypothetical protein
MNRKLLGHRVAVACGVLILAGVAAAADEKPALSGTWGKKEGELKMEFADKEVLKIAPHGDSAMVGIVCQYKVGTDGLVDVKVTGLEGQEEFKNRLKEHVPVGTKFSFRWTVEGATAKLDTLKGESVEAFKSHLEGEYEKK